MNTRHLKTSDLAGRRWRGLVRESSEAQAEKWSPERQRDDLRRAADELGLVGVEPLFYERTGSGETVGAPELEQALVDGRAGQYDVLIVTATSRFARNRAEAVRMKAAFAKAGIVIYFVAQRLISGTYAGGLTEGIHEVIDEQENETRRFWIAGGQRQRQLAGRWVGTIPYGLRKVLVDRPDGTRGWDGALEPDPATGPIVRRMFERAAAGDSARVIVGDLNLDGLRSPTGLPWEIATVNHMLTNPVYAGRFVRYRTPSQRQYFDRAAVDGYAEVDAGLTPVVEPGLFDQIGTLRSRRILTRRERPYPLSGILRCECGFAMTGQFVRRRYYRCSGRIRYGTCDAPSIRADDAEAAFAEWLGSYRLPADWREAIARTSVREFTTGEKDRQAVLREQLARIKKQYAWGDIPDAEYKATRDRIKGEMAVTTKPAIASLEALADALANLGPMWTEAPDEIRATIPSLVLKSAEVEDGRVATWVVDAALRPLLELCVPSGVQPYLQAPEYTVRYSA
jgi:site-specific DNA recombinase